MIWLEKERLTPHKNYKFLDSYFGYSLLSQLTIDMLA